MTPERKKLLDRVLALLALAEGSGSSKYDGEARSARAKAEELMRQYNLSFGEGSTDRALLAFEEFRPWSKGAQWEYIGAFALGKLCGCAVYWYGDFEHFVLAGTVGNLEALRFMLDSMRQQRIRAWNDYKKTGPDGLWSFMFAFARALERKVDRLLDSLPTALAERDKARLWYESTHQIDIQDLIGGPGTSAAGRAAGANVSLHRGDLGRPAARIGQTRRLPRR